MEPISAAVKRVIHEQYGLELKPELTRPEEQFGDFATNVAMRLAGQLKSDPRKIAQELAGKLRDGLSDTIEEITIAGPGFINLRLKSDALLKLARESAKKLQPYKDKQVVVEYSDPSSFKVLHAGHLYTSIVGDAIANLIEVSGGVVHRVNFGGDVGLHVAKTMWAIIRQLGGESPDKLDDVPEKNRPEWMSQRYVEGNSAYEDDPQAKIEITELNKRIYKIHELNDHNSPLAKIYWICRKWSYDSFDLFYDRIGSHFEKYYPESETMQLGAQTVREQLAKGVYEESDGAIIFRGEKFGLHTRVFINSQSLPTYEAKDVGLTIKKWQDYHYDTSIILTDNSQANYMTVVIKSIEQFAPDLARNTIHLTHGVVKLAGGVKMSSRKGNILRASDVLDAASEANKKQSGKDDPLVVLGAVKYAFLKQRLGADIVYDPQESVSLEGNSGPYLQYAHARASSILRKPHKMEESQPDNLDLQPGERSFVRKLSEYPDVINKAVSELMPHNIATYLYELTQEFNRFYEHNRVIGDEREAIRRQYVDIYKSILSDGLGILGITAPERM